MTTLALFSISGATVWNGSTGLEIVNMSGINASFSRSGCLRLEGYTLASGYGTSIFTGDPVVISSGLVTRSAGTAADAIFGGVSYIDANGKPQTSAYWPASTVATDINVILFVPTADSVMEVQADDVLDVDAIGTCYDLNMTAGSTLSGQSAVTLDVASADTTGAVKVVGIRKGPNTDGTYNDWDNGTAPRVLVRFAAASALAVSPV